MSGPQLAECGDGTLLVEIDHIHDEVVRLNDTDQEVLLQVGRREVSYVERNNRGPCVAMAVTTTWPIRGTHGFKSVGLGHLGIDISVWKYRVHGAAMRSTRLCIYRRGLIRAERLRVHFARMRGDHFGLKNP